MEFESNFLGGLLLRKDLESVTTMLVLITSCQCSLNDRYYGYFGIFSMNSSGLIRTF